MYGKILKEIEALQATLTTTEGYDETVYKMLDILTERLNELEDGTEQASNENNITEYIY